MFSLLLHAASDHEDFLIAELSECGTAGITEEDGAIRAFFDDRADRAALLANFAEFSPELRQEQTTDWEQVTKDAWPSMPVGERFYLVPPWSKDATPPGRLRLEVYPGMACGTGRHPATQLCLRALERYIKPGACVLDVGAGSGILSAAAALLRAGKVVGCDTDFETVRLARERHHLPLFAGSIDAVRSGWADVIVANIDSATVELLAPEFTRVAKPGAIQILSGFPAHDIPEGLHPIQTLAQEEWRCLVC